MSYAREELFNESDESDEANPVLLLSLVNADCMAALIRSLLLCPYEELHQRRTAHPRPCPRRAHNLSTIQSSLVICVILFAQLRVGLDS
jgi:hypothetical protein